MDRRGTRGVPPSTDEGLLTVHVLTFEGCPHAAAAWSAARAAASECEVPIEVVAVDLLDPTIRAEFKGYPSPTILVGMKEVPALDIESFSTKLLVAGRAPDIGSHTIFLREDVLGTKCLVQE